MITVDLDQVHLTVGSEERKINARGRISRVISIPRTLQRDGCLKIETDIVETEVHAIFSGPEC